jgi:hypothetical protein
MSQTVPSLPDPTASSPAVSDIQVSARTAPSPTGDADTWLVQIRMHGVWEGTRTRA